MDGQVVLPAPVRGLAIDKPVYALAMMLPRIFECFAVMVLYALAAGRSPLLGPDCSINPGTPDALLRAVGHALCNDRARTELFPK